MDNKLKVWEILQNLIKINFKLYETLIDNYAYYFDKVSKLAERDYNSYRETTEDLGEILVNFDYKEILKEDDKFLEEFEKLIKMIK